MESTFTVDFSVQKGRYGIDWNWHENQLQNFFESFIVDTVRTHQMRVLIDALDECGQDVALDLVELFRRFTAPISICLSCRHYPLVALEAGNELRVDDENERDIRVHVQDKIEAHIQRTDIAEAIRGEIVSRSQGNFQWVVFVMLLVLKAHKGRKSWAAIQRMLRNTPAELNELYTQLLDDIEEHERLQSLHLLQWICFAYRPLTLTELHFAFAVSADTSHTSIRQCQSSELYVETDEDMELRLYDICKGLAEVSKKNGKSFVQLIHQSAKDFLLEKGFHHLDIFSAGTVVGRGHFWLSRSCIKYLCMEEALHVDIYCKSKSAEMEKVEHFALMNYAAGSWLKHVIKVEKANMPQDDLVAMIIGTKPGIVYPWYTGTYHRLRLRNGLAGGVSLLFDAAACNLTSTVKAILTQTIGTDQRSGYAQMALYHAAEHGHAVLVELLLNRDDVDVNWQMDRGRTPLLSAAEGGHAGVVVLLLRRDDVDVNLKDTVGRTPLFVAAKGGHEVVVDLLLKRDDVSADEKDSFGDTPLSLAVRHGHEAVVEMLMSRDDVDVDSVDQEWNTKRPNTPLPDTAKYTEQGGNTTNVVFAKAFLLANF